MNDIIREDEQLEDLQYKGYKILQKKSGFKFGIDAVLATFYAECCIKASDSVIDFGTGSGIIAILIAAHSMASRVVGVEIQKDIADMAKRSVVLNNIGDRVEILNEDLRNISSLYLRGTFDHVVSNPPYKRMGSGIINDHDSKALSRHEVLCTLEDVVIQGSFLLKPGGFFTLVQRPERLNDIIELMRRNKLEPKFIRFVYPSINKPPVLVLVRGVKDGKSFLKVEKPLIIYNEDGNYTEEINEIYSRE